MGHNYIALVDDAAHGGDAEARQLRGAVRVALVGGGVRLEERDQGLHDRGLPDGRARGHVGWNRRLFPRGV